MLLVRKPEWQQMEMPGGSHPAAELFSSPEEKTSCRAPALVICRTECHAATININSQGSGEDLAAACGRLQETERLPDFGLL